MCAFESRADASSYPDQTSHPYSSPKCNEFTFDALQSQSPSGQNISYHWDFGDGQTSMEPVVTHTYRTAGDYTVNLTVTDNSGFVCSSANTTQQVRVAIPPQVALISEEYACVKKPLTFEAVTDNFSSPNPLMYSWNFGDGTISKGKREIVKSYQKGGDYKIQLTVTDQSKNICATKTIEHIIHVNEPPQAQVRHPQILRCVTDPDDMRITFDASPTRDANNDTLSYLWDFGDGQSAQGEEVTHFYNDTGNYEVKLVVSDNTHLQCGTDVDFVTVKLNHAPKADAGPDTLTCPGDMVDFDGSQSFIHKKGTAMANWTFGDGTSQQGLNVKHQYSRPGKYQATLTIENKLNAMCPVSNDTRLITVNARPTVQIKTVTSECADKEVFFDASSAADSDGDQLDYYWNFGDGSTSRSGAKVTHRYAMGGNYRVSVIVDDLKGTTCSNAIAKTNITINTPPVAHAGPNQSCCADQPAPFTASSSIDPDGDPLTYIWDMGDGTRKRGENITHAYSQPGSYNVQLTVDDGKLSACSQSTDGFIADVKDAPKPVITIR